MLDRNNCAKPEGRMHFRGIRSSKFKHVYGAPAKRLECYENVKITRNAGDSNFCAVNPKFLAVVVEVGGGGSFLVLPLDQKGRITHAVSKVRMNVNVWRRSWSSLDELCRVSCQVSTNNSHRDNNRKTHIWDLHEKNGTLANLGQNWIFNFTLKFHWEIAEYWKMKGCCLLHTFPRRKRKSRKLTRELFRYEMDDLFSSQV